MVLGESTIRCGQGASDADASIVKDAVRNGSYVVMERTSDFLMLELRTEIATFLACLKPEPAQHTGFIVVSIHKVDASTRDKIIGSLRAFSVKAHLP